MTRFPFLLRLLLVLWLSWCDAGNCFPAEAEEENQPVTIQPEQATPPIAQPSKKTRTRRRTSPARNSHNEPVTVEVGKDVTVAAGESVPELVVIAGNAVVDGTVRGSLVVISGSAKVNGQIERDLVSVLGEATLGPQAHIGHDAVVVGGPFKASRQATIDGQRTVVALNHVMPNVMWLQNYLSKGLLLARPFPPQVKWVWIVAMLFLLVYLAMALLFPRSVRACVETLESQPMASFFLGLLLCVLLAPLLLLLLVTVVGIPVIPLVVCAWFVAAVFGKVAVYSYAGQQVGRQIRVPEMSLPGVLLLGAVIFYVVYMVPVLGFAVWGIVTLLGLGAALLAATRSFGREQSIASAQASAASANVPPPVPTAESPAFTLESATPEVASAAAPDAPTAAATATAATIPPVAFPLLSASDALLLPHVGFWRRFLATALDFVLLVMAIPFTGPFFIILWVAYHVGMWVWKGTTVGGVVMSIKIVRVDGQPLNFAVAFVRSLSSFFSAFALGLGFFWAGWDRERQAWHDKIAGTVVVRVPKGMSLL